eukprot:scaffold5470_cov107-Isochrysis_galbana.AAC.1
MVPPISLCTALTTSSGRPSTSASRSRLENRRWLLSLSASWKASTRNCRYSSRSCRFSNRLPSVVPATSTSLVTARPPSSASTTWGTSTRACTQNSTRASTCAGKGAMDERPGVGILVRGSNAHGRNDRMRVQKGQIPGGEGAHKWGARGRVPPTCAATEVSSAMSMDLSACLLAAFSSASSAFLPYCAILDWASSAKSSSDVWRGRDREGSGRVWTGKGVGG